MMNNTILLNQNVIITGAAGLFALQHINAVLSSGGSVILIDLNKKKLENTFNLFSKKFDPKKIYCFVGDVTNENSIKRICKKLIKNKKSIDVLINNAAVDYKLDKSHLSKAKKMTIEGFDLDIWKRDLNVGLLGSFICTKIFGHEMAKKKKGVILNIASDLSFISPDNRLYNNGKKLKIFKPISYSVVKHGIIGLTRYTATYWANKNIRCNAIAPGGIYNNQPKQFLKKISKLIPMGRLAKKNEYEASILYLISDASSYTNGAVLSVDGGRTVW